ncbi:MAG: hypothetical protein ACREMJ_03225 [Gemmatimonadales bacterium]
MRPLSPLCIALLAGGAAVAVPSQDPDPDFSRLATARVVAHPERGEFEIELAPVDLPAGAAHEGGHGHGDQPPVSLAVVPVDGALYGFRAEVIDSLGRPLPSALLHHLNVIEPDRRELFLPISRRLLAAGRETGSVALPRLLFGIPLHRGQRLMIVALLHNPLGTDYYGVRVRVVVRYTPDARPWPLFQGAPFQLDVAFPVGDKAFDLPPGRSVWSYDASPAVPGAIVVIGGHFHDYGVSIALTNVTTGETLWRAEPVLDSLGRLRSIPVGRLFSLGRMGARVVPGETYRVTVVYDNPTGHTVPGGGMGVVGGLFVPDDTAHWPGVDPSDSLYRQDLRHYTRGRGELPLAHAGH